MKTTKVCRVCQEEKTLDEFSPHRACVLGVRPECKPCHSHLRAPGRAGRQKAYRSWNREAALWSGAKSRAKTLGLPFDLRREDIVIPEVCPVLGIPITPPGPGPRTDNSPSVDRIIPERGYVRDNIAIISWRANRLKNNATLEELEALVDFYSRRIIPAPGRRKVANPA